MNEARDQFTHSLEGSQALGVPWGTGNVLSGLAWVALATDDTPPGGTNPDEAITLVRESPAHIRELHDKFAFVYALVPLAAAAVLKGDDAWAARILGARDAVTQSSGATVVDKSVHDLREEAERKARARLGPDRWTRAYAAGRRSSIDALLKDIDGILQGGAPVD